MSLFKKAPAEEDESDSPPVQEETISIKTLSAEEMLRRTSEIMDMMEAGLSDLEICSELGFDECDISSIREVYEEKEKEKKEILKNAESEMRRAKHTAQTLATTQTLAERRLEKIIEEKEEMELENKKLHNYVDQLQIKIGDIQREMERMREEREREKELTPLVQQSAPVQNGFVPPGSSGEPPSWILMPYKERIADLKEQLRLANEKIAELERRLWEVSKNPESASKYSFVEEMVMEDIKSRIKNGTQTDGKSEIISLAKDFITSGGLSQVLAAAGVTPPAPAEMALPPAVGDPYADIPNPSGVVQHPTSATPNPSVQQQSPQEIPNRLLSSAEVAQIIHKEYPNLPLDLTQLASDVVYKEVTGLETPEQQLATTMKLLKVAVALPKIGVGVKNVHQGVITPEAAANFLLDNAQYQQMAILLVETGWETWLQKASVFGTHPRLKDHVAFLQREDIKPTIGKIVDAIREEATRRGLIN